MMVPKQLESALDTLFSPHPTADSSSEHGLYELLRDEENHILCVLETYDQPDWLIVPLFLKESSNRDDDSEIPKIHEGWGLCAEKKNSLEVFLNDHPDQINLAPWISNCLILDRTPSQTACCFPCDQIKLVSRLVEKYGPPPSGIIRDWNRQRLRFKMNPSPSASEVLVTEDGILIPFWQFLRSWIDSEFALHPVPLQNQTIHTTRWNWPSEQTKTIRLPATQSGDEELSDWITTAANESASQANSVSSTGKRRHRLETKQQQKHRQAFMFAVAGTAACVLSLLVWWLASLPSSKPQLANANNQPPRPTVASPTPPDASVDTDHRFSETTATNGASETIVAADVELTTMPSTDSLSPGDTTVLKTPLNRCSRNCSRRAQNLA